MLLRIPAVLTAAELARVREIVLGAEWADGKITAGTQSSRVKNNLQLPEEGDASRAARALVLEALRRNATFFAAALPRRIFPPLFNRYEGAANAFGSHVDNSVRTYAPTGESVRTDLSATLFLAEPGDYDGGGLVIEHGFGAERVKLPAGDLVLYPASSVHRVEPVTRGARLASFFWVESMVRGDAERRALYELDLSIMGLRESLGDVPDVVRLTSVYHNLLRLWVTV